MYSYNDFPSTPGYYLLILKVRKETIIHTRGKRTFSLKPGIYFYIGSARGPGGLRARLYRHFKNNKNKLFWHIDFLTTHKNTDIIGYIAITLHKDKDLENILSNIMKNYLKTIPGFGCSDKREDESHLFYCGETIVKCLSTIFTVLSSIQNKDIDYTINILTPTNI